MELPLFLVVLLLTVVSIVPALCFGIECLLSVKTGFAESKVSEPVRSVVLIPAHNEEKVVEHTLESLIHTVDNELDSIVIIADNCTDETYNLAKAYEKRLPLTVLQRNNTEERGKGYALDFGREHIAKHYQDIDIVVSLDADCVISKSSLKALKALSHTRQAVVQSCYLIKSKGDSPASRISEFAFMVKNKVRLLGLSRMSNNVPVTGSGIAYPASVFIDQSFGGSHIVEDMLMGVQLAGSGKPVLFCMESLVESYFPENRDAMNTQGDRWEHGHLSMMKHHLLPLIKRTIQRRDLSLAMFTWDFCIPPLTMLIGLSTVTLVASVLFLVLYGGITLLLVNGIAFALMVMAIAMVWIVYGREIVGLKDILRLPFYILGKFRSYLRLFDGDSKGWVKTDRD